MRGRRGTPSSRPRPTRAPHSYRPALTVRYFPVGAGLASSLDPQQSTSPDSRAQLGAAVHGRYFPVGASAWLSSLDPQQSISPDSRTAPMVAARAHGSDFSGWGVRTPHSTPSSRSRPSRAPHSYGGGHGAVLSSGARAVLIGPPAVDLARVCAPRAMVAARAHGAVLPGWGVRPSCPHMATPQSRCP